uniref:COesterase domain-containing protein n=1 Tax=Strongyloides stercoralis TaxID=6248 RepID=A0A0K0ED85_STRER
MAVLRIILIFLLISTSLLTLSGFYVKSLKKPSNSTITKEDNVEITPVRRYVDGFLVNNEKIFINMLSI